MDLISGLLELVLDNLFVVVILFSVVSFLVNKLRGAAQPNQTPRRSTMPPFGGEGPFGGNPMAPAPATPTATRSTGGGMSRGEPTMDTAPVARSAEPSRQEVIDRERFPEQPSSPPLRVSKPEAYKRSSSPVPKASTPSAGRSISLHARNAAQGMIWSEVFGPPRALKQHQIRKR
jgi:hypothetical protein